jgi:hypothetical protein
MTNTKLLGALVIKFRAVVRTQLASGTESRTLAVFILILPKRTNALLVFLAITTAVLVVWFNYVTFVTQNPSGIESALRGRLEAEKVVFGMRSSIRVLTWDGQIFNNCDY